MASQRRKAISAGIGVLLTLVGCSTAFKRNEPGTGFGQIFVGSPRIEGRERLINDRREQERWLRDRLVKLDDAPLTVSGAVELNSLASTAFQLGVSIDPNLRLNALNRDREAAAIRQAADNERAVNAFQSSARDQINTRFNKGELTAEQAKAEFEKVGIPMPAASVPTTAKSVVDAASVAARTVSNTALGANSSKVDLPHTDPRRTEITNTPIEEFRQRLADREVLRSELNDIRLDDLHDLSGNTLYRLTFDTSVLPQDDASAWAVVRVSLPLSLLSATAVELRARAEEQFARGLRDGTEANFRGIANRLADECYGKETEAIKAAKTTEDQLAVFRRAFGCGSFYVGSNTRRAMERHLAAWPARDRSRSQEAAQSRRNLMLQLDNQSRGSITTDDLALRRTVLGNWAEWLGEVIDSHVLAEFDSHILSCFNELRLNVGTWDLAEMTVRGGARPRVSNSQHDGPFRLLLLNRDKPPVGLEQRCGGIGTADQRFETLLRRNLAASVYAATPKESVQTISEVASNRRTKEMLLNLNAVTGAAGIAAGLQTIRSNEAFQHALRRQPLVVGLTEKGRISPPRMGLDSATPDELSFGWVLGPAYKLSDDGKSTNFRHTVAQRTVTAELSLPAWMDQVTLNYETYWQREDGTVVGRPEVSQTGQRSYTLELPAQPAEALTAIDERYLREPRVDAFQELRVVEDAPARVLIAGRNLWRSTDVYIGTQPADQLAILPDNRGVLATFDRVVTPHGAVNANSKGDVWLSLRTSEGNVLAGQVTIVPKEAKAKVAEAPKAIEGITTRIVAGVEHRLVLPEALPAATGAVVRIGSKKDVELKVLLDKTTQLDEDRKTIVFSLPRDKVPNLKPGDPVNAVLILTKGNAAVEIIDLIKDGAFFENEEQLKAVFSAKRAGPKKPISVTIKFPRNASLAFRGMAKGTVKAATQVSFGVKESNSAVATCTVAKDVCSFAFTPSDAFKAKLAEQKDTDVKVVVTLQGNDVPEMAPKELKLK